MNKNVNYDTMTVDELILQCKEKDSIINNYLNQNKVLSKNDIMRIYQCKSDKALRILKLMFQMGFGNKIGKEYYISSDSQYEFLNQMRGREVFI